MTQGSLFPQPDGKRLRDVGIESVLHHACLSWKDDAIAVLRRLAMSREHFTSDDLHRACEVRGIGPSHPNSWGAICAVAAKQGVIAFTGRYRQSRRPSAHARMLRIWRGNQA